MAGTIKGTITDKQTREPLTGATVQIAGTTQGAIADMDGNYSLDVKDGTYTLYIKYVGYKDIVLNNVKSRQCRCRTELRVRKRRTSS